MGQRIRQTQTIIMTTVAVNTTGSVREWPKTAAGAYYGEVRFKCRNGDAHIRTGDNTLLASQVVTQAQATETPPASGIFPGCDTQVANGESIVLERESEQDTHYAVRTASGTAELVLVPETRGTKGS